jgi:hypothetical protein
VAGVNGLQIDGLKQFRSQPFCVGPGYPEGRSENASFVFADFVLEAEAVVGELGDVNDRTLRVGQAHLAD